MILYTGYSVVTQEIPTEISLAFPIADCPFRCKGCHSPELQSSCGMPLTKEVIDSLLDIYQGAVSCVLFLGDGCDTPALTGLMAHVREKHPFIKTAVYSGYPPEVAFPRYRDYCDYIKTGMYFRELGPLTSPSTNQRLFHLSREQDRFFPEDITYLFWKKKV